MNKIIIYQIFTRLFGNRNTSRIENGTIAENGCGKFNDFDAKKAQISDEVQALCAQFPIY